MATLNKVLKEIKLGKEVLTVQEQIDTLFECIDEGSNVFLVSKRIVECSNGISVNEEALLNLKKVVDDFRNFEDASINEEEIANSKRKMIADNIIYKSKKFIEESEKSRKCEKAKLGKAIATINFGVKTILENTGFSIKQLKSNLMNVEDERLIEEGFLNEML